MKRRLVLFVLVALVACTDKSDEMLYLLTGQPAEEPDVPDTTEPDVPDTTEPDVPDTTEPDVPDTKPELVWVTLPSGTYQMGSTAEANEHPVHPVTITSFEMLTTEVTAAQYQACASARECDEASTGSYCTAGVAGKEQHPINCVTWKGAKAFCEWVEARLCTEAEWEYAARSGTNEWDYPWGDSAPDCSTNNKAVMSGCNCDGTCPVCSKTAGNSSQGVCDLAGNVWEWVEDCWHDGYTGALATGFPAWTTGCSGSYRVVRGGSWADYDADYLRASNRSGDDPYGSYYLGLRCCRSN